LEIIDTLEGEGRELEEVNMIKQKSMKDKIGEKYES